MEPRLLFNRFRNLGDRHERSSDDEAAKTPTDHARQRCIVIGRDVTAKPPQESAAQSQAVAVPYACASAWTIPVAEAQQLWLYSLVALMAIKLI